MRKADTLTMKLTPDIISAAILGYEAEKAQIEQKIAELRGMLAGGSPAAAITPEASTRKRRTISAAGRKAIAEAQRKRWAAARKAVQPAPAEAPKPKRKLSAAGRKRIIEATKKRWAAVRAAKAQQEKAEARKPAAKKSAKKPAPAVAQPTAQ